MSSNDRGKDAFLEEAKELLAELETSLPELEANPNDKDLISRVFRAMHTIKGSGSLFGFDEIAKFTHELESAFDLVRNGRIKATKELVAVSMGARDMIKTMLDTAGGGDTIDRAKAAEIISRLKAIVQPDSDDADGIVPALRETFKEEAYELIAELEAALLELDETPGDMDLINRIFRVLHTIKGSGAACKLNDISSFTHEVETVFHMLREDKSPATKELIELTLKARDQIKGMLDMYYKKRGGPDAERGREIAASFKKMLDSMGKKGAVVHRSGNFPEPPNENITYRIAFHPSKDIFRSGMNPILLFEEIHGLGDCTVVAHTEAIPLLEELDPESCCLAWDIILTTAHGENAIRDAFIFVQDGTELKIEPVGAPEDGSHKKFGEILVERGEATPGDIEEALTKQRRLGDILEEAGAVKANAVEAVLAEQRHLQEVTAQRQKDESIMSVRVPAEKLDRLVDLVGELVTVQARLSQAASQRHGGKADFLSISEEVERLTAELRDNTMGIRMMPIGPTFGRFKRLVRDLSRDLGKEIELTTEGAQTELDKTVIERLSDPLVHLIRNSIDHGIESPEARVAAGKPRQGNIHLAAVHSGANVLIRIADDGAGIDAEAVRSKAIEKKLIPADVTIPEKDLFALLFEPGFSTAQKVTNVSGRGVGMDVVKKTIDALRGSVEVSSTRGMGTTMILKLPLTLAIIDGFLTRVAAEHFILPLALVEECVELNGKMRAAANGRHMINVRGHVVPYLRLREQFQIGGEPPAIEQIVIARVNEQRIGFTVDAVIGGHQTVIKNLGKFYQNVEGISGATILGDGTVALILDAQKLVAGLERHGRRASNCWEFKKCGREQGGAKSKELGVCPVYPNHGRRCAQVAGSLCGGTVQGTFAKKLFCCSQCDFYTSMNYA